MATNDYSSLSQEMQDDILTCSVCMDLFVQPKMLPCAHTVCLGCLQGLLDHTAGDPRHYRMRIKCPTCRRQHSVPSGGLEYFPNDHRILKFTEVAQKLKLKTRQMRSTDYQYCLSCKAAETLKEAVAYCFACVRQMCAQCRRKHDRHKPYSGHLVAVFDKTTVSSLLCKTHQNQFISYLCSDCDVPICQMCLMGDHCNHHHVNFVHANSVDLSEENDLLLCTKQQIADLTMKKNEKITLKGLNRMCKEQTKKAINAHFENQMEILRKQQNLLKEEVDQYYEYQNESLEKKIQLIERSIEDKHCLESKIGLQIEPLSGFRYITHEKSVLNEVIQDNSIKYTVKPGVIEERPESMDCVYIRKEEVISGGFIKIEPVPDMRAHIIQDDCRNTIECILKWDTGAEEINGDVCLFPEDTHQLIYVCGFGTRRELHMYNYVGNRCDRSVLPAQKMATLFKVASSDRFGMVLFVEKTSEGHTFSTFYTDSKSVEMFVYSGQGEPRSAALDDSGHIVVGVVSEGGSSLICYTTNGNLIWHTNTSSTLSSPGIMLPFCVNTTENGRLVVADPQGHQIHIFSASGEHEVVFPANRDENLKPLCVCPFTTNRLLVGFGRPLFKVSLFTESGMLMRHVTKLPCEPTRICFDRHHNLLAVATLREGLLVYELKI